MRPIKLFGVAVSDGPDTGAPRRCLPVKRSIDDAATKTHDALPPTMGALPPPVKPDIVDDTSARPVKRVIEASPRPVGVKKHIGLHVYYRFARSLLAQAGIYREKHNHVNLYAVLLRFLRLLFHTILKHPDYRAFNSSVKFFFEKKQLEVIDELEYLKPIVQKQQQKQQQLQKQEKTTEDNIGSDMEPLGLTGTNVETVSMVKHTPSSNTPQPLDGSGTASLQKVEQHQTASLPIIQSNTPILKHLVPANLNQDGMDGRSATSQYSPTNSRDSRWFVSVEESTSQSSSSSEEEFPHLYAREHSSPSILSQVHVDSIPKQIISTSSHSTQGHGISDRGPYQMVYVPGELTGRFLNAAAENTAKSLETCGIIAGTLKVDMDVEYFIATDLIIPKQESTSCTCEATNEEEILDMFQQLGSPSYLGWIHTHPTQECFMSSVDLHNHYSYQKDLKEAFAIVVAPSKGEQNIFHLTVPDGMDDIGDCDDRGFHPHDLTTYEECSHVKWDSTISLVNVVDLRD